MPLLTVNHHYFRAVGTGQGIYPTKPDALVAGANQLRSRWRIGDEDDILRTEMVTTRQRLCAF